MLIFSSTAWAEEFVLHTEIRGLQAAQLANVQERLSIVREAYGNHITPENIQTYVKTAPHNIRQALEPFGYFKATVQSNLTHHGNQWTAYFYVNRGPALHITAIDVNVSGEGKDDPQLKKLLRHFPLQRGQVFQAEQYEAAKKALFETANNQGYIKAMLVKKEIRIDLQKNTVFIDLHLETGQRYYFGAVRFEQAAFTEEFLERFIPFKPGEPFSSEKLLAFQQNLTNSHYFQQIAVDPDLSLNQTNEVPVDVSLKPTKSQQYNIGIGYGTYTGPRLSLGANFRHLTKTGHYLSLQTKLSPLLKGFSAQYVIPGKNPLTDAYTIGANAQKFSPKNGTSISKSLSFTYSTKWQGWKITPGISYLSENYRIYGDGASHNSKLLIPSLNLTWVKADDLITPRFGRKIDFVVRGASNSVLSTTNFVQSEIKGKYIVSPTQRSTLVLAGDFGYTTVENIRSLPLSLQFFAGGMNSVRGFPYTYFGPGRYLKVGSVELRHQIYDKWSGAVFYDIGTAADHLNAPMGHGIGVGAIYNSVIGPIRIYTGFGSLKNKPTHFDLEFSIGPEL